MDKAYISVVTPSFNTRDYLKANIESVQNQKDVRIEHIIVDGGSTDGTVALLESFPHLVWDSKKDNGQSDAINQGFHKAKGDFIGWLNSDDVYEEEALKQASDILRNDETIDMVVSDLYIIDEEGKQIGKTQGGDVSVSILLFDNPIKQPTLLMRRRVIDRLKGLDESLHFTMDREFWLRMLLADMNIKYIKGQFFAGFRLIQGTKTFEQTEKFREEWGAVISKYRKEGKLDMIPEKVFNKAIRDNKAGYFLSLMNRAFNGKQILKGLIFSFKVIKVNPNILLNLGFYKLIIYGTLGKGYNRLRKYNR